jgi:tetratricopeptide (TPR) repeat protein
VFRYDEAVRRGDWSGAIELTEKLSRHDGEREDDGKLGAWEMAKVEFLVRLGDRERALRFGERQAMDAPSLSRLALLSLDAGALDLAQAFCERALRFDAAAAAPAFMFGRAAEFRGELEGAKKAYADAIARDRAWFRPHAALAKLALAQGDAQAARAPAESALKFGHTHVEPFVVRGQVLFAAGERASALKDLGRAWQMIRPELKERDALDGWAVRALAMGDAAGAASFAARYLSFEISPFDRQRMQRFVPSI